ncbi:aminotransferase class I/II-fold pyridoxal phosphate-dependent enzyme [Streptomyces sp. NBC_01317]|uniref:aminotransferase class I/II-fold pyridoxal phosphate-dependent enzyme n=1 Tax=Streptomyces sp. NBC_01317 TaxID=2903822 RepID=UPI002E158BA5|nr:aminotransferase class I/II-fold pyridoxal phosphate-dependent enzyme [Streptomyces sp. NBC_01317]
MTGRSLDGSARSAPKGQDSFLSDCLAAEEREFAGNREVFDSTGLRQGGSVHTGPPDTAAKILGRSWSAPVVVGPLTGLVRPDAEPAVVRAAGAAGLPVVVSAFTARTFADLASAAGGPLWLRTHTFQDRALARGLVDHATEAGFGAVILAVGPGEDVRLAPGAAPANLAHDGPAPSSPRAVVRGGGPVGTPPATATDWSDIAWLRSVSSLPLLVAGVRTAEDAERALEAGADGIVTEALDTLPRIVSAVAGRGPVLLTGGVRSGADVLVALASGADAVMVDHPLLDGLLTDGPLTASVAQAGDRGAGNILDGLVHGLRKAMEFTGTGSPADAAPGLIRTSHRPARVTPARAAQVLRKSDLHASVSDPVLDTMTFLNEVTHRYSDAISFAPGRPYDGFFDTEQIVTHIRRYLNHLAEQGRSAQEIRTAMYQYGPTAGQIRGIIADSLRADENIDVAPESIVVTVGAQEAMLLVLRALITGPDDVLLAASPCYVGITGAARLLDIAVTAVEEREDGLSCDDLEAVIRQERARGRRPRAFYVVPDHSNPSGTTMSSETRADLLELAERHGILILEDSPYRLVSPGTPLPTLKSLDRARTVVHLGSFAKTVFPGARVGFAVADQRVVDSSGRTSLLADELAKIKSMVTVNTSSLSQAAVAGTLLAAGGRISEVNTEAAAYYGTALRDTIRSLEKHLPADRRAALGVRWNEPTGGFFLTVHVPFRVDNAALTRSAQEYGVIWTPMSYFYPQGGGHHGLRLSISYLTPAEIEEGTARLARFIEAESAAC